MSRRIQVSSATVFRQQPFGVIARLHNDRYRRPWLTIGLGQEAKLKRLPGADIRGLLDTIALEVFPPEAFVDDALEHWRAR